MQLQPFQKPLQRGLSGPRRGALQPARRGGAAWVAAFLFVALFSAAAVAAPGEPVPRFRSDLARAVIQEMNRVRTNPQGYATYLETLRGYYGGDRVLQFPGETGIRTQEGVGAVDDAIRALRNVTPVPRLNESAALKSSARMLANEQAETGGVGHFGRNGATPFNRMARYGAWLNQAGEDVSYGRRSARRIVADLVIDDGVSNRGHRRNILNEDFRVAGAGFGLHPRFGTVCVIDFATAMAAR